jgi:hypothetical protein
MDKQNHNPPQYSPELHAAQAMTEQAKETMRYVRLMARSIRDDNLPPDVTPSDGASVIVGMIDTYLKKGDWPRHPNS